MDTDSLFNLILSVPTITSRKAFITVHKDLTSFMIRIYHHHTISIRPERDITPKLGMSEGV